MALRMLALDLDGTTLNHMGELSDGVRDAEADHSADGPFAQADAASQRAKCSTIKVWSSRA